MLRRSMLEVLLILIFNKSVKKLSLLQTIDEFILPFVIFFAARYLGIFIATYIEPVIIDFGFYFYIPTLPLIEIKAVPELLFANSLSWIFTASIMAVVFGFTAFRILHLNENWLHPKDATRIHQKGYHFITINGIEALHQITAWSLVTLTALNLAILDLILGNMGIFAFGFVLAICSLLTVLFLLSWLREEKLDG